MSNHIEAVKLDEWNEKPTYRPDDDVFERGDH
jgi:hypothetical protein